MRAEPPTAFRPSWAWFIAVLVAVLAFWFWIWRAGRERRAIVELPAAERQAAFQKARDTFHALCLPTVRAGFEERCATQARFLRLFPECDQPCVDETDPALRRRR